MMPQLKPEGKLSSGKPKILLLEDDMDDAWFIQRCVPSGEYSIVHHEYLKRACQESLGDDDVIITDLSVHDSKGMDTFKALLESYPSVPIIIVSGLDDPDKSFEAAKYGAYNFIDKNEIDPRIFPKQIKFARERAKLDNQLREARKAADNQSQMKSEFLAQFSHEIRTPLNAVVGMTKLLKSTTLDDEQSELVEGLELGGNRLLSIVNDILDISKIESGKMELNYEKFDLRTLVSDCIRVYSADAETKGIFLSDYFDSEIPAQVEADPDRIKQVLMNYLSNAMKYTEEGTIIVEVSFDEQSRIRVGVQDSGEGIPQSKIDKLFSSFVQVNRDDSTRGTGLGLVVCKNFAELMGGEVGVHSEEGKGSEFWFSFVPKSVEHIERARSSIEGKKILIFGQDIHVLEILQRQLGGRGVAVTFADASDPVSYDERDFNLIMVDTRFKPPRDKEGSGKERVLPSIVLFDHEGREAGELKLRGAMPQGRVIQTIAWALGEDKKPPSDEMLLTDAQGLIDLKDMKVLVVDDDPLNRKVLAKMLKTWRIQSDFACHGQEALNCCAEKKYDVIFMDCTMPVMDGYEASRRLKAECRAPKIVALTAHAFNEERERCQEAGMDHFLTKPIDMETLKGIVEILASDLCNHKEKKGA
ncbi:response regulator [Pseudobacteriovorax antillogorgiicola]|uniref:Sensory/regulatory protein RpfC n=1 Tax=Pseudobacteriovorax antillogorgiicola TaxID=1513793 RepID=A0A1Y6BUM9_9BACT|nr:response regulator [Pseudobacteriovorax antillogorgiicola]TCS53052.1 response regulator receiver domain-containing protein [Pseudobacteriovorax antillogorgiicola]SMF26408.1 Response regulator receiver domain-containing protein [Pseudobacteriovorax antillogorgiicola]